ncbi:MAG: F0F1 ATP synthase subunit delta [Calditrichia bacterium]
MRELKIARRYALALFEAAEAAGKLDSVKEDLTVVQSLFEANQNLLDVFLSPVISKEEKISLINELFLSNAKLSELTVNFLKLLVEKFREAIVLDAIYVFESLYNEKMGLQKATLITALEADDNIVNNIRSSLEKLYKKKFIFEQKVDPSIIGGFLIRINDSMIDATVRNDLQKLKDSILTKEI